MLLMTRSIALFSSLLVCVTATAAPVVTVTEISGEKTTGEVTVWDGERLSLQSPAAKEFPRSEVRTVTQEGTARKKSPEFSVWLSNGDHLSARAVRIADDNLTIFWPLARHDHAEIPLERVVALILAYPADRSDQVRLFADLQTLPAGSDTVLLTNQDRSHGVFERLEGGFIDLKVATKTLKLDRTRIEAVRFDPELTNIKRTEGRRYVLTFDDGSLLTVTSLKLMGDVITGVSPMLGPVEIPVSSLLAAEYLGDRIVPLADYTPEQVEFVPYLSGQWPLVTNANVLHGPLIVRGTEFTTGLGMHSRMRVTYRLTGKESQFRTAIGIDDAANGAGSATFAVSLDDKPVWISDSVTGKSPIEAVGPIDVRGKQRLTLLVDFGQFADVSDYADWCDPVLILEKSR